MKLINYLLALLLTAPMTGVAEPQSIWLIDGPPKHPDDNQPNEHRTALGQALFFDPKLSGDGSVSCASCH